MATSARFSATKPRTDERRTRLIAPLRTTRQFLLPFVLLLVFWWGIKLGFGLSTSILPSPWQALDSAFPLIRQGIYIDYVTISLIRIAFAAAVGLVIGVPFGLLLGSNRLVYLTFRPLLNILQGVSGIAWLPMALVWSGFGDRTILVIVLYALLFPVIFNTMLGVQTVPSRQAHAVRVLGATRRYVFLHVWLPGALPSIVTGARLGIAYGWRELIAAEMLMNAGGLGYLLFQAESFHGTAEIVLDMATIGLLWIVMDRGLLRPIEQFTVERWGMLQR